MSFEELVEELEKKSGIPKHDILDKVNKKHKDMRDLITKEGALILVAKESGIELEENNKIQIKDIDLKRKSVNIIGRIFKISKINEFQASDGNKGRVVNLFIGDNTGTIRLPLWNDQVKIVEEGIISIGDIVQINNAMPKENLFGDIEISLGRFGSIKPVDEYIDLPDVDELMKKSSEFTPERTQISNLTTGGIFEVKGTIVQIFKGNFLFNVCSMCSNRITDKCNEHGEVTPNKALVLPFIIDDGTADIRCVMFRDAAEKFCGINSNDLSELEAEERFEKIKKALLGKEVILVGRVKKNKIFDKLELIASDFKDINALEESMKISDELDFVIGG